MPRSALFSGIADALEHDWRASAREEQIPPPGHWTVWLYMGGRGTGKTRSGAEAVHEAIARGKVQRVALIGPTAADVRDVMVEGESGLLAISPQSQRPHFEPSKRRLTWPNGAIATMYSAEEPDRLRGPQHGLIWFDELAACPNAQGVYDVAMLGLRLGKHPRVIVTTTPRPIKLLKSLLKRDGQDVVVTVGKTLDNVDNLPQLFIDQIMSRYAGTRLGRQELNAELLEDVPGALWTRDVIEQTRRLRDALPPMRRIVVAIDPAVSVSETSDETGIIVVGLGTDGHAYVLEDASGRYQPIEWARRAITLYGKWHADRIVAEANQGGAMVESTIRSVDENVSLKLVHASKGKIPRAEPISALFEQNRAHIVGSFEVLEDQLCTYEAGSSRSPDRLDAMVWGMSEIMLSDTASFAMSISPEVLARARGGLPPPRRGMRLVGFV